MGGRQGRLLDTTPLPICALDGKGVSDCVAYVRNDCHSSVVCDNPSLNKACNVHCFCRNSYHNLVLLLERYAVKYWMLLY
jgi:hypothetical protein